MKALKFRNQNQEPEKMDRVTYQIDALSIVIQMRLRNFQKVVLVSRKTFFNISDF